MYKNLRAKLAYSLLGKMYRAVCRRFHQGSEAGLRLLHDKLGLHETEQKIITDSQVYWEAISHQKSEGGNAHWRGNGVFESQDARWQALGLNNLRIFERMVGARWLQERPRRIIDWGSGGGANAVHFGRGASRYYGLDITQSSLAECGRQMTAAGLLVFEPVLLDAAEPEQALTLIREPCDLVLSTYVYELFPSKNYGVRVLRLIYQLLASQGRAFIQIKYSDLTLNSQTYQWGYAQNMPNMTTYRIEEFWSLAETCGFQPEMLALEPQQPLVHDRRYAYFLLKKP